MKAKNIVEAMASHRPTDKIVKVLSNKFAIVLLRYESGKFSEDQRIMGLHNGVIYTYCLLQNVKMAINNAEQLPNTERERVCLIHPGNKARLQYIFRIKDNRKFKAPFRKLKKLFP